MGVNSVGAPVVPSEQSQESDTTPDSTGDTSVMETESAKVKLPTLEQFKDADVGTLGESEAEDTSAPRDEPTSPLSGDGLDNVQAEDTGINLSDSFK